MKTIGFSLVARWLLLLSRAVFFLRRKIGNFPAKGRLTRDRCDRSSFTWIECRIVHTFERIRPNRISAQHLTVMSTATLATHLPADGYYRINSVAMKTIHVNGLMSRRNQTNGRSDMQNPLGNRSSNAKFARIVIFVRGRVWPNSCGKIKFGLDYSRKMLVLQRDSSEHSGMGFELMQ